MKICKISGCNNKIKCKGFCPKHYERLKVHGDPWKVKDRKPTIDDLISRIKLLMDKPNDSGCMNYLGAKNKNGYGIFSLFGKTSYAHRAIYELFKGNIPKNKMICHTCDNRSCINIDHLWVGDHDSNMKDMVSKKRSSHGIKNVKSKLSEDQVIIIKKRLNKNESLVSIAADFNLSYQSVRDIKKGNHWKYILAE